MRLSQTHPPHEKSVYTTKVFTVAALSQVMDSHHPIEYIRNARPNAGGEQFQVRYQGLDHTHDQWLYAKETGDEAAELLQAWARDKHTRLQQTSAKTRDKRDEHHAQLIHQVQTARQRHAHFLVAPSIDSVSLGIPAHHRYPSANP
ncbi:hypothetical protein MY10362_001140 [Beauveria mimosiformis]